MNKKIEYSARLLFKYGFKVSSIKACCNMLLGKGSILKMKFKKYPGIVRLRRNSSDLEVFNDVLLKFCYDFKTPVSLTSTPVILDCGANIGLTSIFFKSKYPNAEIYSVEPEKGNYELMVENLGGYDDIHCLNVGIWSKDANLTVDNPDASAWGFSFHETEENQEDSIKALSIKSIMKNYGLNHIDILKIDVEGAEKKLFETDCDYWLSKTRVLIVELHDRRLEGCSKAFFNALSRYNFSTEIKGDNIFCFMKDK